MDQVNAIGRDLAAGIVTYFGVLLAGGFERAEAMELTAVYQAAMLGVMAAPSGPPAGGEWSP